MTYRVGLTVRTTNSRPHLRGVVLDDAGGFLRTFEHQCNAGNPTDMLHSVGEAVASNLALNGLTGVTIREAGYARGSSGNSAAAKNRLRAEGVLLSAARARTENVRICDLNAIGHTLGKSGDEVTADAVALLEAAGVSDKFVEAATAALVTN